MTGPLARLLAWLGRRRRAPAIAPAPDATSAPARASVLIPALNEAARIADVVRYALADPVTAEVVVIDDSSIDDTARLATEAGAKVITSTMLGKGASMRDGALAAAHELVVYLDGDLSGLRPGIVGDLCAPLAAGEADFVKARFGRGGGRVTELTAKPMLKVFFPELARFAQPLGGIIAARRSLLRTMHFEDAYGVDIGLLIDAHRAGARIAEVDIGSLEHDSQPLLDLTAMANEVSRVVFARARAAGRLNVDQITAMYEAQRQAAASLEYILSRRRGRTRLLLLDLDGTLTAERYVTRLAELTGRQDELAELVDGEDDDSVSRSGRIAALFRFVHREQFERAAHSLPIRPGTVEWINRMRRAGFMVGVVSDSYFVAAEIVRRRVFADFAVAHTLRFEADVCDGVLRVNPAFEPLEGDDDTQPCKRNVIRRIRADDAAPQVSEVWVVGDSVNDLGMLREADRPFVIGPRAAQLAAACGASPIEGFDALISEVPAPPDSVATARSREPSGVGSA